MTVSVNKNMIVHHSSKYKCTLTNSKAIEVQKQLENTHYIGTLHIYLVIVFEGLCPKTFFHCIEFVGYYVYFEASSGVLGSNAKLKSLQIPSSSAGSCLQFWIHMYGANMGALNLYARNTFDGITTLLWKQNGTLSNMWVYQQMDLMYSQDYEVISNDSYIIL